jgi:hypothetical protein
MNKNTEMARDEFGYPVAQVVPSSGPVKKHRWAYVCAKEMEHGISWKIFKCECGLYRRQMNQNSHNFTRTLYKRKGDDCDTHVVSPCTRP